MSWDCPTCGGHYPDSSIRIKGEDRDDFCLACAVHPNDAGNADTCSVEGCGKNAIARMNRGGPRCRNCLKFDLEVNA